METWEHEVREDAVAYSMERLAYYEDRLSVLNESSTVESLAKRCLRRHYERMIAKEKAFLATELEG